MKSQGNERLPIRVETPDARGSTAGEAVVPTPDTVTVVDFFATWCAPCDDQLEILSAIRPEYTEVPFILAVGQPVKTAPPVLEPIIGVGLIAFCIATLLNRGSDTIGR